MSEIQRLSVDVGAQGLTIAQLTAYNLVPAAVGSS